MQDDEILTVSELTEKIKVILEINLGKKITVNGEISNYKLSGDNLYFTLKDSNSAISVVLWGLKYRTDLPILKNGDKVKVTGIIKLFSKNGTYNITATKIELDGIGELYKNYLEFKDKYESMGYFDQDRKKKLPIRIKNIGVATAIESAALQDFLYVFITKNFKGNVYIDNCFVQGKDCPTSVAKSIEKLDAMNLDVIIITRGGGSYEDLFGFSHPTVLDAIYNCNTCVISAIGHEIDTMLSDLVADIRQPTPTASANFLCEYQKKQFDIDIDTTFISSLQNSCQKKINKYMAILHNLDKKLVSPRQNLINIMNQNNLFVIEMKNILQNTINSYISKCEQLSNILESSNPLNILNKGFCLLRGPNDVSIVSCSELKYIYKSTRDKKKLRIQFKDGSVLIDMKTIEFINNEPKKT